MRAPESGSSDRWDARRYTSQQNIDARARSVALIVDDDPSIRDLVGELLSGEGYRVELAEDGLQALDHLRASSDRVVTLLDIMMPALDGIEVLKRVAADDGLANRHGFVIMTASSVYESDELTRLIHEFNAPVLKKPFSIEGLLEATNTVAERLRD